MWLLSCKPEHWEPRTMEIITVGLDLDCSQSQRPLLAA